MATPTGDPTIKSPIYQLNLSKELADVLAAIIEAVPAGAILSDAALIARIILSPSAAADTVETMALTRKQEVLDTFDAMKLRTDGGTSAAASLSLNGRELLLSSACYDLLVKAGLEAKSQGRIVTTMDVLKADAKRKASIVSTVFQTIGQDPSVTPLLIERYAEQKRYIEKGSVGALLEPFGSSTIQTVTESPSTAPTPNVVASAAPSFVINLGDEALKDGFDPQGKTSRQLVELLAGLEFHAVTVLTSENQDDADRLVNELAVSLNQDKTNTFNVTGVYGIRENMLESNPGGAISAALARAKGGILYIPRLDQYLTDASSPANNILRNAIAANDLRIISYVSTRQWQKVNESRDFLRAYSIPLEPPTSAEAIAAIKAKRGKIEQEASTKNVPIKISDEAVEAAVKFAARYMPGGEVALLRQAVTLVKIGQSSMKNVADARTTANGVVDDDDVILALYYLKGVVVRPDNPEKYVHMEETLRQSIIGQDEAVAAVSKAIRRSMAGLKNPRKPIGSFLFLGPTGVGKTELGRALAEFLFDDADAMLRLNMSEYYDKHTIAKLVGAAPGYVGYEEGGELTNYVRRHPYSVIMADEIEKANPEVMNAWLQVLDDGRITDGKGQVADCRNTVQIFTSNVGTEFYALESTLGREKVVGQVEDAVRMAFRPEFLGRCDAVIIFHTLTPDNVRMIVDLRIKDLNKRLADQTRVSVTLTDEARELVAKLGYKPESGAREIDRVINSQISDALTEPLLRREYNPGDVIEVSAKEGKFQFSKKAKG